MSREGLGWSPFFANQLALEELETVSPARVIAVQRSGIVLSDGDAEFRLPLGSSWFSGNPVDRPTAGDWLLVDLSTGKAVRLLERKSLLKRLASGPGVDVQLIAANVDTIFVVTSCNDEFNESRLERYLALASDSGAEPVVVLTKQDIADDPHDYADRVRALSTRVAVELVNALDTSTLDGVRAWCRSGQTVALIGSSGVGKSTLVNTLTGRKAQLTSGIREQDARGRHTTTSRSLHRLDDGALLLDVPGLRELGMVALDQGLSGVFDDIASFATRCRFADCGHEAEPGCAVRDAIEAGELDERRFRNYQKLLREEARNSATIAQRNQQQRKFGKQVKSAMNEKERNRRN